MKYILETKNLTKQYGKVKAVNEVSLHVKQGEIYGFIGRNGAGKTTLMRMVTGLAGITDGEVSIYGKTNKDFANIKNRIGCLIEAPGIFGKMSAKENIKAKCMCVGINKPGYVEDLLELVGLADTGNKKTKLFSLGMRQRLGIALALVGEPDILMLDEPINGLDPQGIAEIRELILKLNHERNITIFISSHILEELAKIATTYGIIHKGQLIKELTHEELMEQCGECIVLRCDEPEKAMAMLDRLGYTKYKATNAETIEIYEQLDNVRELNKTLVMQDVGVYDIHTKREDLEDYFLNLTSN